MKQRERQATQRILAIEAIAKLRSVSELFGVEDIELDDERAMAAFKRWDEKITELERWIWDESPIA
ncbi:DUF6835 domain-containing protein [Aeromonas simiae]|uniref:DUF6835 domain-containing protein n=1 Tax=Aeromonas simiae TaxID=218936 RepID=UPI00266CEA91|nr:hypothetical protein [Aeromonas simiae]MDO2946944.1 hypothetical protein [Aeromonas simiae]MDO2950558.1 hypothetical protein [Aeromonas simiae]MDO2954462.1 hypothetical protein [Aeromonas simiae]